MKKLVFAGIAFLLFPALIFAQEKKIELYDYTDGIRSMFPSKIIEIRKDKTEIYRVEMGLKDMFPSQLIDFRRDKIEIYNYNEGIRDIFPILTESKTQTLFPTQVIKPIENVYQFQPFEQPSINTF